MSGCDELFQFAFYEYLNADTMKQKAGYFVLSAGMFFCELSAKSSAPFYLVLAEMVILMVMHGRQGTRLIKKGAVWISIAVVLLGLDQHSSGSSWTESCRRRKAGKHRKECSAESEQCKYESEHFPADRYQSGWKSDDFIWRERKFYRGFK